MKNFSLLCSLIIVLFSVYTSSAQNKSFNLNDLSAGSLKSGSFSGKTSAPSFPNANKSRELVINPIIQSSKSIQINDTIQLDLFENKQYKAYIDKIDVDVNGTSIIRARLAGYEYGSCIISTFNGKTFMTIEVPEKNELYMSKYDRERNKYYLLQIDKSKQKALEGAEPITPPKANSQNDPLKKNSPQDLINLNPLKKATIESQNIPQNQSATSDPNSPATITLMIVYTPAAAAWSSANEKDINNTISLLIAKAQLALDNSNTLVTLKLVYTAQVDYTELNNDNDLLNLTNANDGIMDNVRQWRDTYCADIVVLLENMDYTGGKGWILNSTLGLPDYAFSINRVQQASWTYNTIHEIGHNMGCHHTKIQNLEPGPGLFSYSAGWRWNGASDVKYCDAMTYESGQYFADGINATAVPYFSNPDIQYQGIPTGDAVDGDNARTIRETKSIVASYRHGCSNCTPPTTQATAFTSSAITDNSMTIGWSRGNGTSVLVVARKVNNVPDLPINETAYSANIAFGYGTQIGEGNYVVYNGTGTSVNIEALRPGTLYNFDIYEYNSTSDCYLKPALTGTVKTAGTPPDLSLLPWKWQNPLPQGNQLNCVKFVDASTGYAVGDGGTIIKTINGGIDWEIQASGTLQMLNSVFFIDSNTGFVVGNNVILKTINGGIDWVSQYSGQNPYKSVFFTDENTGYVVGDNSIILKTTNGGEDWIVLHSDINCTLSSIFFTDLNTGYVAGFDYNSGIPLGIILKTTDGGLNWTTQYSSNSLVYLRSAYFPTANTGFAVGYDENNRGIILKTTNGGVDWIQLQKTDNGLMSVFFTDSNTGYAVSMGGYDQSSNILKTTNGGIDWTSQSFNSVFNIMSVNFTNTNIGFAVGNGGSILKTSDGGINWKSQTTGTGADLYSVFFTDSNIGYAGGNSFFKTTNGGETWIKNTKIAGIYSVYFTDAITGYAVGGSCPGVAKIYKTTNGGADWTVQYFSSVHYFFNSVFFTDANTGYVVGDSGNIYKTTNAGKDWEKQVSGISTQLTSVYFTDADIGYIVGVESTILKTINGGTTWIPQTCEADIGLFSVHFANSNTGYAVGWGSLINVGGVAIGKILKTTNGGKDWKTALSLGNMSNSYNFHSMSLIDSSSVYVVGRDSHSGVLVKTFNGGKDWTTMSIGTANELNSIFINDAKSGYVVGQFSTILKITTDYFENKAPVANAGIDQNVNEGTTITLDGSASLDPDESTISYKWTAPAGITLSSLTAATPTFTAPEVDTDTDYAFSLVTNDGTLDSPADQVSITVKNVSTKQQIALNMGWNIISSRVVPTNLNLKPIFQPLIDAGKLKKIMDETGKTIENFGGFGGWVNNIGDLVTTEGFKVNVTAASNLSFEGTPVQLPFDINLNTGWNIISYPSTNLQDAKVLIQSLIDAGKLKKVMDEGGKTIENFGGFGGWVNNIGNLLPGKGYKVSVTSNCILTILVTGTKSAVIVPELLASSHFKPVFTGNGTDHTNIHLVDLQASGLQAGDEIGVFDGKLCVGSATIGAEQLRTGSISIPASANDELGETVNGFTSGHSIELLLYRGGQTSVLKLTKISGNELFEKNGSLFATVNFDQTTRTDELAKPTAIKCYPNPFTDQINIEIQFQEAKKLEVRIYDINGKLVRNLFKGKAGKWEKLVWDGKNGHGAKVVPGTYVLKANEQVEKIILKK